MAGRFERLILAITIPTAILTFVYCMKTRRKRIIPSSSTSNISIDQSIIESSYPLDSDPNLDMTSSKTIDKTQDDMQKTQDHVTQTPVEEPQDAKDLSTEMSSLRLTHGDKEPEHAVYDKNTPDDCILTENNNSSKQLLLTEEKVIDAQNESFKSDLNPKSHVNDSRESCKTSTLTQNSCETILETQEEPPKRGEEDSPRDSGFGSPDGGVKMYTVSSDSPYASSDVQSEGSSDSGKGGSDIQNEIHMMQNHIMVTPLSMVSRPFGPDSMRITYQFEMPSELCGILIGRQGFFVKTIKTQTNANICVNSHPIMPHVKICSVKGTKTEVRDALYMIREKFPVIYYPHISLQQINNFHLPQTSQLPLPEGVTCDVLMSSLITAGHFFLQQPTHPTYPALSHLDNAMSMSYADVTPPVTEPLVGMIVAVPVNHELFKGWFRAMIVGVNGEIGCCDVKFVDYGGYSRVPTTSMRQMRADFMPLPFQSSECLLSDVLPVGGGEWTSAATAYFEQLARGQRLQCHVKGYTADGRVFVRLLRLNENSTLDINAEMVERGYAVWTQGVNSS